MYLIVVLINNFSFYYDSHVGIGSEKLLSVILLTNNWIIHVLYRCFFFNSFMITRDFANQY